jgi:hypothetical protein
MPLSVLRVCNCYRLKQLKRNEKCAGQVLAIGVCSRFAVHTFCCGLDEFIPRMRSRNQAISHVNSTGQPAQPRQHEADPHDGVFKFIETRLRDQPRPRPIDQRLTRLPSLRFKIAS